MKKLLVGMAMMALVLSASSIPTLAAGRGNGCNGKNGGCNYHSSACQYVDENNDGICDNCGKGSSTKGTGFVDADGDGICDNYGTGAAKNGSGCQRGKRHGR